MTDRENTVRALEDIAAAINDPDADYTEEELNEIRSLQASLRERLKLTEAEQ